MLVKMQIVIKSENCNIFLKEFTRLKENYQKITKLLENYKKFIKMLPNHIKFANKLSENYVKYLVSMQKCMIIKI